MLLERSCIMCDMHDNVPSKGDKEWRGRRGEWRGGDENVLGFEIG